MSRVGFVGGDLRQLALLDNFYDSGYSVKIYGYDTSDFNTFDIDEIYCSDIIVFPMPSCNGDCIFAPFSEEKIYIEELKLPPGKKIFYAGANEGFKKKLDSSGSECIDYMKSDDLVIKNAVLTAEGAVEIALNETEYTLFGADVLVLGYGRVAKALAKLLKGFGTNVCIAARRAEALAQAWADGFDTVYISEIEDVICEFNIIYNTIPSIILDKKVLASANSSVLIIDLASKPGGVDFESAGLMGIKVIWALSLPGKTAPVTAGNVIFETLMRILKDTDGGGT